MTGSPPSPLSTAGEPVAVVEVGSGSVKLLVTDAEALATGGPDRVKDAIKTRLWPREGTDLEPERLAETEQAFARFAAQIEAAGAATVAVIGTAVAREATDVEPLDRLSRSAFGAPLEVVTGAREAELGFAGATAGRQLPGPLSVIDIGAGSTELAIGDGSGPVRSASLAIGSSVLTDAYLHRDPPGPDELSSALSVAELHYDDLRRDLPDLGEALAAGTLLGVGAVGQIAAVEIGLPDPSASVDGYRLPKVGVEEVFRTLATECAEDRAHNPGLRPEHVDDIVGALCVLVEFLRRFDVAELVVSERAQRHGRAAELVADE